MGLIQDIFKQYFSELSIFSDYDTQSELFLNISCTEDIWFNHSVFGEFINITITVNYHQFAFAMNKVLFVSIENITLTSL